MRKFQFASSLATVILLAGACAVVSECGSSVAPVADSNTDGGSTGGASGTDTVGSSGTGGGAGSSNAGTGGNGGTAEAGGGGTGGGGGDTGGGGGGTGGGGAGAAGGPGDASVAPSDATDATAVDADASSNVSDAADAAEAPSCDDTNPCTVDSVGADGGCINTPLTGTPCDDGDACNGTADVCSAGVCRGNPGTLREDFNAALDSSKWTTSTIATNSSISVAGGVAFFTNRAFLNTVREFSPTVGPVRVTAQVNFTAPGTADFLTIATRSDGVNDPADYNDMTNGIGCQVDNAGTVGLRSQKAGVYTNLGMAGPLVMGANIKVILELFDDGNNVVCTARTEASNTRVVVNGTSNLVSPKNLVSLFNRENSDGTHTLTVDNVTVEAGVTSRPYAQWQFEDVAASTKIVDWAGAYDGTYGTAAGHAAGTMGNNVNVVGNANSYADLGTSLGSLGISDFTLAWWSKGSKPVADKDYLGNRDTSSGGQYFGTRVGTDGKLTVEMYGGAAAAGGGLTSPTVILDDTWHHVAVERKGATLTIFVDGAQVATGPVTGQPNINSTKTFLFGKSPYTDTFTNYFTGAVDDLRLYNRALPLCEVKNVYGVP
jgi:hypothetical protein